MADEAYTYRNLILWQKAQDMTLEVVKLIGGVYLASKFVVKKPVQGARAGIFGGAGPDLRGVQHADQFGQRFPLPEPERDEHRVGILVDEIVVPGDGLLVGPVVDVERGVLRPGRPRPDQPHRRERQNERDQSDDSAPNAGPRRRDGSVGLVSRPPDGAAPPIVEALMSG